MKIYAIRHGQTDLNAEKRVQGCKSDLSLNNVGIKQAKDVAEILKNKNIDLIVTSPLKRAMETADIIANRLNIKKDKIIQGQRLYERNFGDYEGRPISEVDINALRRWTDNAPTPNGETIRELSARVFAFLDDGLPKFKDMVERDRRPYLDDQYKKRHGDNIDFKTKYNIINMALEKLETSVLFIVHGHVLRAMHWYFNGLPEEGNETVIETDNCGFYEFDTDKIPLKMKDVQIYLDRQTIEEKLKRLSTTPYKATYTTCFAMCYMPGDFKITYENYQCPVCGKKTKHTSDYIDKLSSIRGKVREINLCRIKVDATLDEREYCSRCNGKACKFPEPVFKIRFSPDEKYHEVKSDNYYNYKCLLTFLQGMSEYEGGISVMGKNDRYPLVDCVDQIVEMTGLCPEIVNDWRALVEKEQKKLKSEEQEKSKEKDKSNSVVLSENEKEKPPLKVEIPIITARERVFNWLEMLKSYTKPSVISASKELLDNLLCYATILTTGDYGYDRNKYDSFQEYNIASVAEGLPEGIIAHNELGNGVFTRIFEAEKALSKSQIDELIKEIIELSKDYPPMNEIKSVNIKNIITYIEEKRINTILWTVREEEIRKTDNEKILTEREIEDLIELMLSIENDYNTEENKKVIDVANKIINHIISVLDTVKLPYQTYSDEAKRILGLDNNSFAVLYDSIQKDKEIITDEGREKSGFIIVYSDKGYQYKFIAEYKIYRNRQSAYESLKIERKIQSESFCSQAYSYCNEIKAAPVEGDVDTIAKRIISRLFEIETEEDKWVLGGSLEAEAETLFRKIPRRRYDSFEHTSYEKGRLIVIGDDGFEYIFNSSHSYDNGGSEGYGEDDLVIECASIKLHKTIYSSSYYIR